MIPEGRYLSGLDEFMLRLNYWGITCHVSDQVSAGGSRFVRALTNQLSKSTAVPTSLENQVAAYLLHKHMSGVRNGRTKRAARTGARYSDLWVDMTDGLSDLRLEGQNGERPRVWYQDLHLARPEIPSPLGAVTFGIRKSSSKSGISHVLDWMRMVGLLRRSMVPTALGQAVAESWRRGSAPARLDGVNGSPFDVSGEAPLLAHAAFSYDGDALVRVLKRSGNLRVVNKRSAIEIFAKSLKSLEMALRRQTRTRLTAAVRLAVRRECRELWRDMGTATEGVRYSSTAGHRSIPRFEHLTDLGFFKRPGDATSASRYTYSYEPLPRVNTVLEHIRREDGVGNWLNRSLFRDFATANHSVISADSHQERLTFIVRGDVLLQPLIGATKTIPLLLLACQFAFADQRVADIEDMLSTLRWASMKYPSLVRLVRGRSRNEPGGVLLNHRGLKQRLEFE